MSNKPSWNICIITMVVLVVGKIMLSITGAIIFVSAALVIKLTKPIEYRT